MEIIPYSSERRAEWDAMVARARNGYFLFYRGFMEYHSDRFTDMSLMAYDERGHLVALLPASVASDTVTSHGGLTFGGFIIDERMTTPIMLELFTAVRGYLAARGIKRLVYKCSPSIYHHYPAEEEQYALFVNNAQLIRRDVSTTIDLPNRINYNPDRNRNRNRKKGLKNNFILTTSTDWDGAVELIGEVLGKYHDAHPVHTAAELALLAGRFPDNIRLHTATKDGELYAVVIVFDNGDVVHTQYLANSDRGRKMGALDCLLDHLITQVYADRKYFDFGISTEDNGRFLNDGLIKQKEGFGGRAVVYDFYELDI